MEERPIPQPGPNEVQVEMQAVGICGSDVHYWQKGCIGDFVVKAPMVLGHEPAGIVSALGEGVKHLKVGDRVALEPGVPCRMCEWCRNGSYNLCPDITFSATPPYHGTLTRYYVHAADFCFKLPDHVSFEEGALLEPLAVGVHACRRARIVLGSKVLITGAGPIGLVSLLAAKAMGASKVVITDITDSRLTVAKQMGADFVLNVAGKDPKSLATEVASMLGGLPDSSIECSGAEASTRLGIYATKSGGTFVLVGMGGHEVTLPMINALINEIDIRGVFRYANCYPTALEMVATGKVDVKPLITHRYTLEQALDAFETTRTGAGGAIKVMIHCGRQSNSS